MAPIHYAAARARVNAHFGAASADALTVAQVKEAGKYMQGRIDALPAVPSAPPSIEDRRIPDAIAELRELVTHSAECATSSTWSVIPAGGGP